MREKGSRSYPIPISAGGEFTVYRGGSSLLTRKRRLCSVVERLAGGDADDRGVFHGLPWCTPILGSGCLELGDGPSVDIHAIDQITRDVVADLGVSDRRELGDLGSLARAFAEALRGSRTHDDDRGSGYPAMQPTAAAARLTVLSALLTRLFHGAAMSLPTPTSRWWVKQRAELTASSDIDIHLRDVIIPTILELLDGAPLTASGEDSNADLPLGALGALGKKISEELRVEPPAVCIEDLQLITEMTWLELIRETSIYPGWSDLLLQLLMTYSESDDVPAGHRPKVVALAQLGQEVANLLQPATERSWNSRADRQHPTERDEFYSAIAHLLHAQAEVFRLIHVPDPYDFPEGTLDANAEEQLIGRAERATAVRNRIVADTVEKRGPKSPIPAPEVMVPHAVVFVTSFDVEMEMALWASGRPYRVVVPVLATTGRRDAADLIWLSATVNPSATEDGGSVGLEFLNSGPHEWRIAQKVFRPGEGGEQPTVVRLSGSPLMNLPDVSGALYDDFLGLGFDREAQIRLFHALIIDEYTSLRQSENELFFAANQEPRGLPGCLSGGTNSNDRLWVGLGVQIDDPAIRARIFSQLSAGSMIPRTNHHEQGRDAEDSAYDGTKHAVRGLAVNQRIDEAEATALHWLGFQFAIQVSSGALTRDIEHCAEHVEEVVKQISAIQLDPVPAAGRRDANWRRAKDKECDLWRPTKATRR